MKIASVLLILSAWLLLLPLAAFVHELIGLEDVIQRAAQRTGANANQIAAQRLATQVVMGVGIGLLAMMAVALFAPALKLRGGGRGARTAAVFSSVLSLLCCGGGLGLSFLGSYASSQTSAFETELARLSTTDTPTWAETGTLVGAAAPVLAIVASILLFTPASNEFFRGQDASEAEAYQYGGYYAYPTSYPRTRTVEPEPAVKEKEEVGTLRAEEPPRI